MNQRFAQLSDPHLTTLEQVRSQDLWNKRALGYLSWKRKRRFEHRPEVLEALQHDLQQQDLMQLLVTGDLTHIGLPDEFTQSRAWLEGLGSPEDVAVVPGNHDACVRAPWDKTFAQWQPYLAGDDTPPVAGPVAFPTYRERDGIAFIGLSTGCPKPPLMATGTLGEAQLAALPSLLKRAGEAGHFRVVYLHHSPIAGMEKWRKRLTDASAIETILQSFGAELVVHGHGHRAHYREITSYEGNIPVVAVPSASALGLHGADVACYNCYDVTPIEGGWQLRIYTRAYEPMNSAFVEGDSRVVNLKRATKEERPSGGLPCDT